MLCCARTQASMPFKCSTPGCVSSANGGTRNLGGISLSRLLATSQRILQQSAAGCKQPTLQLGYQEATSFMRTSRLRVHDACFDGGRDALLIATFRGGEYGWGGEAKCRRPPGGGDPPASDGCRRLAEIGRLCLSCGRFLLSRSSRVGISSMGCRAASRAPTISGASEKVE